MDCTSARRNMYAWLDGELPSDEARGMTAHVRGCASCAAHAGELSALFDVLEELPGLGPDPELVRATLRAAAEVHVPTARWWVDLPALYKGAGFAAVAMGLFLGIFLYNASPFATDNAWSATTPFASSILLEGYDLEHP